MILCVLVYSIDCKVWNHGSEKYSTLAIDAALQVKESETMGLPRNIIVKETKAGGSEISGDEGDSPKNTMNGKEVPLESIRTMITSERTVADQGDLNSEMTTTTSSQPDAYSTFDLALMPSYQLSQFVKTPLDSGCYKFTQVTEQVIDGRCESPVSSLQQCLESCAEDPQCEYAQFNQTSSLHGHYCLW